MNSQVLTSINASLPSLKGQKRRLAKYMLENWNDIIYLGISELSELSETSTATITRFYKEIGYEKFSDFKIDIVKGQINKQTILNEKIAIDDDLSSMIDKVFASEIEAINSTREILNIQNFRDAVNYIKNAKRFDIYGFGASGAVVMDAGHKFLKIGRFNNPITDKDIQGMSAALLGPEDVVLAISHSGRNSVLIHNVEVAKSNDAKVIAITNNGISPLSKVADIVLATSARETAFKSDAISSRTAQLCIVDALYIAVAYQNFEKSYENIVKGRSASEPMKISMKKWDKKVSKNSFLKES